uniref:Small ribosomal subunit protein uS15 N-terminal domain-containing protein n=1 Tax=Aotus nancymaae TaxID=37293 RepID=A0A2K5DA03_AOTNA
MCHLHAPGKGLSQSALLYRCRSVPTWLKLISDDVKEQIYKLAKKGLTPSPGSVILRDSIGFCGNSVIKGQALPDKNNPKDEIFFFFF